MPSTMISRIDGLTTSVAVKAPIKIMTSSQITLFGEQTINAVTPDGTAVSATVLDGDRVGVNGQADEKTNGIYVVRTTMWARAKDFDGSLDAVFGTMVTDSIPLIWRLTTPIPVLFGTSNIKFETEEGFNQGNMEFLLDYLKNDSNRVVDSIAALRALKSSEHLKAMVIGYYGKGDGGGGVYYADLTDTTTADNGGTVIVANDGARWKVAVQSKLDIRQWGAKNGGAVDSSTFIQKAFAKGGAIGAQNGVYRLGSAVEADYSGEFPEVTYLSRRVDFRGDGSGNTIFELAVGQILAFKMTGTDPAAVGQGIHAQDRIGGFSIYPQGHPWPTGQFGTGLYLLNKAGTVVDDVATEYLNVGCQMDGVLSSAFNAMCFKNGRIGLILNSTALSLPNANTFTNFVGSGNSQAGLIANTLGASNKFINARIEGNGTPGVGGIPQAGNGGMIVNLDGRNGIACLDIDNSYFEGNSGEADLRIDNPLSLPATVVIRNSTFNRNSSSRYVGSNILATSTGGGLVKVVLAGNGFLSTGDYVPSDSRPFIQYGSNVEIIGWDTCTHSESISIQASFNSASSAVLSGSADGAGSIQNAPPGVTVTRISAGQYNVSRSGGWASTVAGYNMSVTCLDPAAMQVLDYIKKNDANTFTFGFRKDKASAYTDSAFCFQVSRCQ